jgi:hypothetical protein
MKFQTDCPSGFVKDVFQKSFFFGNRTDEVWEKLQRRETFVRGQLPPFRVEFDSPSQEGEFKDSELNIHHGPLLSAHGVIGTVGDTYRDLDYFFGSYVLSFRLARPVKLEFFKLENEIQVKLTTYVKSWFQGLWNLGNQFFWLFSKEHF